MLTLINKFMIFKLGLVNLFVTFIEIATLYAFNAKLSGDDVLVPGLGAFEFSAVTLSSLILLRLSCGLSSNYYQASLVYKEQKKIYDRALLTLQPKEISKKGQLDPSVFSRKILLDISNFCNGVLLSFIIVLTEVFILLSYGIFFIYTANPINLNLDYKLTIPFVFLSVAIVFVMMLMRRMGSKRQFLEHTRLKFALLLLQNPYDVLSYNVFNRIRDRANLNEDKYRQLLAAVSTLQNTPRYLLETTVFFLLIIVIGSPAVSGSNGLEAGVILFMIIRVVPSVSKILSNISSIKYYHSSTDTVKELVGAENCQLSLEQKPIRTVNCQPDILVEVRELQYDVGGGRRIEKLSFSIVRGRKYLIKGQSGSGKTTLLNMLSGIKEHEAGDIQFFETGDNQRALRVAYIPQNVKLFEASLIENISFFREDYCEIQLGKSLEASGVQELLDVNDWSLEHQILDAGANVSGGQAQRIAIARALLEDPDIIIFDETFSGTHLAKAINILKNIDKNYNASILLVTHDAKLTRCLEFEEILIAAN